MGDKKITLEEIARAEAVQAAERERQRTAYLAAQTRLLQLVPERFFEMADRIRDGVKRFNGAAKLQRGIHCSESAAVTTRDPNPAGDFVVEIRRDPSHLLLAMRSMGRVGKPDALLIEASGSAGIPPKNDVFHLRIEPLIKAGGEIVWRTTCDSRPVDTPLDDLPELMVAVVATGELTRLWQTAPFGA